MQLIKQKHLNFSDVNIIPQPSELTSRSEVNLIVSYITKHSKIRFTGIPIIVANLDSTGTISMSKSLYKYKMFVALHKFYKAMTLIEFFNSDESQYSFYTLGISDTDFYKLKIVSRQSKINKICLDTANGYMYSFLDKVKELRELFPQSIIMAGNVCTPDGVENIIKAGADIVKCGIANGELCETKLKTGIGYEQFSVAMECGQTANELNALCCSDGGCKSTGDICKALGAGSHIVMLGSLFCGYEQNEGEWEHEFEIKESVVTGNKVKKRIKVYGMSSKAANDKYCGGLKNYRTSEGKEVWMSYKGDICELAADICGGLSSCCSYTNTKNLENLHKNCIFTL